MPTAPAASVVGGLTTQGATPADEVPFPVTNAAAPPKSFFKAPEPAPSFFEEMRAGEDRAGQRVPLSAPPAGSSNATAPGMFDAPPRVEVEPGDTVGLIKRGLDERRKPLLAITLESARRVAVEGNELCVEFAPEAKHLRDTLSRPENMRALREVCCEVMGREMGVRVNTARARAGDGDDSPPSREDEERLAQKQLRELAEGHPLVTQVRKSQRWEIVEVRRLDAGPQQE